MKIQFCGLVALMTILGVDSSLAADVYPFKNHPRLYIYQRDVELFGIDGEGLEKQPVYLRSRPQFEPFNVWLNEDIFLGLVDDQSQLDRSYFRRYNINEENSVSMEAVVSQGQSEPVIVPDNKYVPNPTGHWLNTLARIDDSHVKMSEIQFGSRPDKTIVGSLKDGFKPFCEIIRAYESAGNAQTRGGSVIPAGEYTLLADAFYAQKPADGTMPAIKILAISFRLWNNEISASGEGSVRGNCYADVTGQGFRVSHFLETLQSAFGDLMSVSEYQEAHPSAIYPSIEEMIGGKVNRVDPFQ